MTASKNSPVGPILCAALGVLSTISVGLAGWALTSVNDLQQRAARFEENIGDTDFGALVEKLKQMAEDSSLDTEQNRRLDELRETDKKFWTIHNSTREWLNDNREAGEPLYRWPVLSD